VACLGKVAPEQTICAHDDGIKRECGPPVSVDRPFYRTARQFAAGSYAEGGCSGYIIDPKFADSPSDFVRAFLMIQEDLISLFEYIEPDDQNCDTYSLRTYELLLRACTEIETNFKAIFAANTYKKRSSELKMDDYKKIEHSHYLSQYEVKVHYWKGAGRIRHPFAAWAGGQPLTWYQAYNNAKHDRVANMKEAKFDQVVDAVCGLVVVLSSQFLGEDFTPRQGLLALEGSGDGYESAVGNYFRIKYPQDVPDSERYDFDWQQLRQQPGPFQRFDYDAI
jgi:hypothetical protein